MTPHVGGGARIHNLGPRIAFPGRTLCPSPFYMLIILIEERHAPSPLVAVRIHHRAVVKKIDIFEKEWKKSEIFQKEYKKLLFSSKNSCLLAFYFRMEEAMKRDHFCLAFAPDRRHPAPKLLVRVCLSCIGAVFAKALRF